MTIIIVDILITAVLLAADLISKHVVSAFLAHNGGSYDVIEKVLTFRYSENTGAAFGIFDNARVALCVFVAFIVLAIIGFMVYHIVKGKHKDKGALLLHVSLSFIVAGGLGNLIDRIAFGYVRDFIEYTFIYTLFKKNFAICNFADVVLTIGVILLLVYLIAFYAFASTKKQEEKAASPVVEDDASTRNEETQDPSESSEEKKDEKTDC